MCKSYITFYFSNIIYHIYPTPLLGQDMTQGQFFKRSLTGLNSEFSFSLTSCLTKAEEPSLSYYLSIAGGRIIGFIAFPRELVLCVMQLVWSRIWSCVAVSISYNDNHNAVLFTSATSSTFYRSVRRNPNSVLFAVFFCLVIQILWITPRSPSSLG